MTPYDKVDKEISDFNKTILTLLNNLRLKISIGNKSLSSIQKETNKTYQNILSIALKIYLSSAREYLPDLTQKSLKSWLNEYNPVTEYLFFNEFERKRDRYAEGIYTILQNGKSIHGSDMLTLNKKYSKYIKQQLEEYSIFIVDKALIEKYKNGGVKKVKWNAIDKDACEKCKSLDGKVFDIDKAPSKRHYGCRCYYTEVKE